MIEIRTFDGDADQMSRFCTGVWRRQYQGQMPLIDWSADFLEWEVLADPSRHYVVAAYDGTKLVGLLPTVPQRFSLLGQEIDGTWGSYFSVDPDYAQHGVSLKLNLELRRRHRQRQAVLTTGHVYLGAAVAKGKDFWLKQPKTIQPVRKLGLWARPLDHRAVSRFELSRRDAVGVRMLGLVQRTPRPADPADGIRDFQTGDLADCLRLVNDQGRAAELGYLWDDVALLRRLKYKDVAHTLVAEYRGRVAGLVNYCRLKIMGRAPIEAGVIDMLAVDQLPRPLARKLIRTALAQMAAQGVHTALALRISSFPWRHLMATGFVALPADSMYVAQPIGLKLDCWKLRRMMVHWR